MPSIDKKVALSVGTKIASRNMPQIFEQHQIALRADFDEFTVIAEELASNKTGLVASVSQSTSRVVDRGEWISANLDNVAELVGPLISRYEARGLGFLSHAVDLQLGLVLGWVSTRVLGQYDIFYVGDDKGILYYVGPNIIQVERRFAFPPRQFRLWIALHEVTHRLQFTGVPWMKEYFKNLVGEINKAFDIENTAELSFQKILQALRSPKGESMGIFGLVSELTGSNLKGNLENIQALMSVLEGHGDFVMNMACPPEVTQAERFSRVLHNRRTSAKGINKIIQQILGLDVKMRQYLDGERFINTLFSWGGMKYVSLIWESPKNLPSLSEIAEPSTWVERVVKKELLPA
jgi:coenzyme F420 biosynthesis associated uncharacterized protein